MNDVTGMPQSAVVVGATSEIAGAILDLLVERRLEKVLLAGRDLAALEVVAATLRRAGARDVSTAELDVRDVARHARFAEDAAARLANIDLVLIAAGVLGSSDLDSIDPARAAAELDTNFAGPAAVMLAFAAVLRRQGNGRIVVLSSVAGLRVRAENFVYGAAKAGLDGFSLGLGDALAGSGVEVVVVRPGFVTTKMTAGMKKAPFSTDAPSVARAVVEALGRADTLVTVPAPLRWVFVLMRVLPRPLWRKVGAARR